MPIQEAVFQKKNKRKMGIIDMTAQKKPSNSENIKSFRLFSPEKNKEIQLIKKMQKAYKK